MATMKDIAKLAGVSHGTVSNVINNKGNVSLKKITKVKKAIEQLGYSKNVQAQYLRNEQSREIAVILPGIMPNHYKHFYDTLHYRLTSADFSPTIYFTDNMKEREISGIQRALSLRAGGIVAVSCFGHEENPYAALDLPVYLVNAPHIKKENVYNFDIDCQTAAKDIVSRVLKDGYTRLLFFCDADSINFDKNIMRELETIAQAAKLEVKLFSSTQSFVQNMAVSLLSDCCERTVVLTADSIRFNALKEICAMLNKKMPVTIAMDDFGILKSRSVYDYNLDYRRLASKIAGQIIRKKGESRSFLPLGFDVVNEHSYRRYAHRHRQVEIKRKLHPQEVMLKLDKHKKTLNIFMRKPPVKLSMITLISPMSDFLKDFAGLLKEDTGIDLHIVALPYEELFKILESSSVYNFDLIRFDLAWSQKFAEKLCIPLSHFPETAQEFKKKLLPSIREAYMPEDTEAYTLPIDPSIQTLFFRKDLFSDTEVKRLYYEKYHKQLKLPKDFESFDKLAAFFTKGINPFSPVNYGITQTYGAVSVAACDFLPRFKSMGGKITDKNNGFCLNAYENIHILQSYINGVKYAPPGVNYWWSDAMNLFSGNQTAMSIVFLNHASRVLNNPKSSVVGKVDSTLVPGGNPLLGGGCVGISKNCQNPDYAIELLKWIYNDKTAKLLTLYGALSPCASIFENEEINRLYPWLKGVKSQFAKGSRIEAVPIKNFDYYRFEQILGMGVRNAVLGISSPEQALQTVQLQCEKEFMA